MKVLSISIASYNIEKYIRSTLDSFIIPEIMQDLEIIVVDDGSKDATAVIAQEYVEKYPGVFVLLSKSNGGYGSTINASCRAAKGKYFKTVDGDDYVEKKGMIELIDYLKSCEDDIVVTNYSRINDKTGKTLLTSFGAAAYRKTLSFEEAYDGQELYMQAIAFKTDILVKANLNITEHCFYTDIEYILTPLPYVKTISFLNVNVYMYRIAVNEQSMSVAGKRKHIDEQEHIFKKMLTYFNSVYDEISVAKRNFFEMVLGNMYKSHVSAILSLKTCRKTLDRLCRMERETKSTNVKIYDQCSRFKTIDILRRSNYLAYWPGSIAYKFYQFVLAKLGR